jgi:hypothetical protein
VKKYFDILGLPESASYEEVKNARIRLLKEVHPDLYAGNKKYAQLRTSEINIAFEALTKYFENRKCFSGETLEQKKTSIENKEKINENKEIKKEKQAINKKYGKQLLDILIYVLGLTLIVLFLVIIFS